MPHRSFLSNFGAMGEVVAEPWNIGVGHSIPILPRRRLLRPRRQHRPQGHGLHTPAEREAVLPGMHHVQRVQFQIVDGDVHRLGERGLVAQLELDTDPAAAVDHQQIEFGALVRGPEVGFFGPREAQDLFERKTFPTGAVAWVC